MKYNSNKEIRVIQREDGKFVGNYGHRTGQGDFDVVETPEEAMDLNTTRHNETLVERAMTTRGGKVKTFTVSVTEKV
jgi:hypothetical protein